ncbi:MAG: DNA polymerase domain-containing protein [Herpetosiphon sp.]
MRQSLQSPAPVNPLHHDDWIFGWDDDAGIVSVWAERDGRAWIWRRTGDQIVHTHERFSPWLFATTLADLNHLGPRLALADTTSARNALVTYRELQGPAGSYRYLLEARPGFKLDAALAHGATRRLNRPVESLHKLDDTYYLVGPVEQYLMATGKVYFRSLDATAVHRLQFDLETTALDPHLGRIFLVAILDNRGYQNVIEAPNADDESTLITSLCTIIAQRDPDVIENHNLHGFDLPFLIERARTLNVRLQLGRAPLQSILRQYANARGALGDHRRMRYTVPGRELVDTLDAVRRYDFAARTLPSHGLKDVARHFGVAREQRVYIPGSEVYKTYTHNPALVRAYALDDVAEVDAISQRLMGAAFALSGMTPRRYERVASAGPAMGILEPMLIRAYRNTGVALPQPVDAPATAAWQHAGGAVHLFATGVAVQVVKADIASLYPSIMRTYSIGPACDRLGVLLTIVNRLTDLRLEHKAAARTTPDGPLIAGHHDAMQAAMKILINSAYGYMGAPAMALFSDMQAADDVTRHGRQILSEVVAALQLRGMALIEADTDGVYFAVPRGWSEQRERALVAQVATGLPAGIRLEYEGRYRAMYSYEVKNYVLLTYDDNLIIRGGALRSIRSEPFGEQFLNAAFRHLLTGNVPAIRDLYLQLVAALRTGSLQPRDVATRATLTKTPAAYLAARPIRQEPVYEALLASGRSTWETGERVRYFRHADHSYGCLDVDGEPMTGKTQYDAEHYVHVLRTSFVGRLKKAFHTVDFDQLFRMDDQLNLFDQPVGTIVPATILCETPAV